MNTLFILPSVKKHDDNINPPINLSHVTSIVLDDYSNHRVEKYYSIEFRFLGEDSWESWQYPDATIRNSDYDKIMSLHGYDLSEGEERPLEVPFPDVPTPKGPINLNDLGT